MRLLPLAFCDVAQLNGVNTLLANGDLPDRSFRREFAPIHMPSKNSPSLAPE
jgi:hypothetical protein